MVLLKSGFRQICYCVDDIEQAATRHARLFGSGPYFEVELPPTRVVHRGKEGVWTQRVALGQWGTIQVELVQSFLTGDSPLDNFFAPRDGGLGIHHVALFVDNLDDAVKEFANNGHNEELRAFLPEAGLTAVFIDTRQAYGHFIEIYERIPMIASVYEKIAEAAAGFDGRDPFRKFQ